ncbi:MAG: hypothetical protein ACFB0B_14690 [Thermonemataceae bacterium]
MISTRVIFFKEKCDAITPLAWKRVVMKALPILRAQGYRLSELMNPQEGLHFSEETNYQIEIIISELYPTGNTQ